MATPPEGSSVISGRSIGLPMASDQNSGLSSRNVSSTALVSENDQSTTLNSGPLMPRAGM
ncbi:hypothetical protein D3C73_415130 [compost metagenome]